MPRERDADKRRWGTCAFRGGAGELKMSYGSIPLRLDASALVLTTGGTPHRFVRLHTPRSGHLNGRYCFPDMTGCLTLTSNGQFKDEGAARILEHPVYPYPLSPPGGQGQYEIRDHSLILKYDRGPELRIAYPGTPDRATAEDPRELWLSFNLDVLKKM